MGKVEPRKGHPYHLHDAIHQQPDRIRRMLASQGNTIAAAAEAIAARKRILFVGIGSSGHAAALGEKFLRRLTGGRALTGSEQAFELIHYPLVLGREDAVVAISHRGWKNYSVQALAAARKAGAATVAVTGEDGGESFRSADFVMTTCDQETSFTHTKSYMTAVAALALLAARVAGKRGASTAKPAEAEVMRLPEMLQQTLASEPAAQAAARAIAGRGRLMFVGAGVNWVTARETALKIKESSYLAAEGFETEEFLHGPIAELDARAALIGHYAGGAVDARMREVFAAAREVGAVRVAIAAKGADPGAAEAGIEVPATPEWLSTFPLSVAGQLFAYHLALERGTNPDTGREHEPAHAAAASHYKL